MFVHSNVSLPTYFSMTVRAIQLLLSLTASDSRTYTNPRDKISGPDAIFFCARFNVTTTMKMPSCDK